MATSTIKKTGARLIEIMNSADSPLRNYTIGTTVSVPDLPLRPYARKVVVMGSYANKNGMMLMPTFANVGAGSRSITVLNMWNTQTNSLQTSGQFDIRLLDVELI